jgi:segregation and condensation protein B
MEERIAILEALIFAAEAPLAAERVAEIFPDLKRDEILVLFHKLREEHERRAGGVILQEVAGGFRFQTRIEMAPWVGKLKTIRPASLSFSAMETLAIVAYRQPVMKAEIDRIRGVDAGGALKGLLEKKLARIVGRKDVPGRPMIYGTTRKFLETFNLNDLNELPTIREMKDFSSSAGGQI